MKINPFAGGAGKSTIDDLTAKAKGTAEALKAARVDRQAKSDRLVVARTHYGEAQTTVQRLEDDNATGAALAAAKASRDATRADIADVEAALERADAGIAQLAAEADAADHRVICEKVATGHETTADKVEVLKPEAETFFGKLGAVTAEAAPAVAIAHGLELFAPSAKTEVDVALTAIADELRALARAVRDGRAKPIMAKTAPVLVPAATVPERTPVTQIFTIRKIRWHTDDQPGWRTAHAFVDVQLPVAAAERAVELGLAVKPADPKAREMRGKQSPYPPPHSDHCADVDPPGMVIPTGTPEPKGPIHSKVTFTPLDRGKPFRVPVAGPAPAMVAARKSDNEEDKP